MIPDSTISLEYDALRDSLAHAGAVVPLAELHGGVCGALCAGGATAAVGWLADCLADQALADTSALELELQNLVNASWQMLVGDDLAFGPLLPDDDAPLDEQVQALASWCNGFLGGLGTYAPDIGRSQADAEHPANASSEALVEILGDFAEISRAGLGDDEAEGEAQLDFALAELVEYVRVSVQLVFEELAERRLAARDLH